MSRYVKHVLLTVAACLSLPLTASAVILTDANLTNTNQLRTASSNPYFTSVFGFQKDVAGVNFHYGANTVTSGVTLLGVGFDNVNLSGLAPPPGPFLLVENPTSITLTLAFPFTSDNSPRSTGLVSAGTDSTVLDTVARTIFYLSNGGNHPSATMTFSGLDPNRDVLVQVIGGDEGWNGDIAVTANGGGIGTWTTVADIVVANASLFTFTTTADVLGDLQLVFTVPAGNFAGIGGIILSQQIAVPEPSSLTLLGLGAVGLAIRTRRRRLARK